MVAKGLAQPPLFFWPEVAQGDTLATGSHPLSFSFFFICLILIVLYVNFDYKVNVFESFQVFQ
jgi:hypothetical protein